MSFISSGIECNSMSEAVGQWTSGSIVISGETVCGTADNGGGKNIKWNISGSTFCCNTVNGSGDAGDGVIFNTASSSTISDSDFIGNKAGNSNGGGAICQRTGSLTITGCNFTDNESTKNGGAICVIANTIISDSTFTGNKSVTGGGGAIYVGYGTLTISNVAFYGNSSKGDGSAIYSNQTIKIAGLVTLGEGQKIKSDGSVIFVGESFFTDDKTGVKKAVDGDYNTTFLYGNGSISATDGYTYFTAGDKDYYITNAANVIGNSAIVTNTGDVYAAVAGDTAYYGNACSDISAVSGESTIVLSGFTVSASIAAESGIVVAGTLTFANHDVISVTALDLTNASAVDFSGAQVSFSNLTDLSQVDISVAEGLFTGDAFVIADNVSLGESQTVSIAGMNIAVGDVFVFNKQHYVLSLNENILSAEKETFYNEPAEIITGGKSYDTLAEAVSEWSSGNIDVSYGVFCGTADNGGGKNIRWNITDSTFCHNNIAGNANSDGVITNTVVGSQIKNAMFSENNSGTYWGGGAIFNQSSIEISNCTFSGNTAKGHAGAIFCYGTNGVTKVYDSTFTNNESSGGGGGAVFVYTATHTLELANVVFNGNKSKGDGSAIFNSGIIKVAGLVTLGENQRIKNDKSIIIAGESFFTDDKTGVKKAVDGDYNTAYIYGNGSISATDGYTYFTAGDKDYYITNAANVIGNSAIITNSGDVYAVAAGDTAYYGNAYSNISAVSGESTIVLSGGVITVETSVAGNLVIAEDASANFIVGGGQDLSEIAITVDGSGRQAGDIIATGVTGTLGADDKVNGDNTLELKIDGTNLVLAKKVVSVDATSKDDMSSVTDSESGTVTYFGRNEGDETDLELTVNTADTFNGTVRAGSASGTDSVIKSTVTGGTFNNNLYGGGLVSAAKTDITVSGTTEVKQILYGGIFVKEKESATDLGESNLTVAGGVFNHNVVGGSRVDVNENALNVTHTTDKVNLTISGGTFAKTGTKTDPGVAVYSAGYVNGIGENEPASTGYDYKVNENTVVINGGVEIKGAVYGGVFACQGGKAYVGSVSISVENAKVDRILGGGWAQTGGKSDVGTVKITLENGAEVGIVYAGGGNAKVGNTEVFGKVDETIKDVAITVNGGDVGEIFMGGRYNKSVVTGAVVVTIESEADGKIDRISGKNGYGVRLENAGRTELVVNSGLTVGMLDSVDKLTIAEGKTLNITDSFSYDGELAINFDLGEDKVFDGESEWTVMTGVTLDDIANVKFAINGTEITGITDGVLGESGYKFEYENKTLKFMLAKA